MKNGFKYSRYAHSEGHTGVCYAEDGKYIITCGTDCDVRLWPSSGVEDDDAPPTITLREPANSIIQRNGFLYVGSGNFVEAYTYPELKYSSRQLRFTATVTDVDISSDGNTLAAGACDMRIQIKNMVTGKIVDLSSHTAPILRVVLSLDLKYLASSSCDGSVKVWDTSTGSNLKTFNNVIPAVNAFISAISMGCPAWLGESHVVIIQDKKLCFHTVGDWSTAFELSSPLIKRNISVISVTSNKVLICAGTTIGEIIVWNVKNHSVVKYLEDVDKVALTGIRWSPNKIEIAYCDKLGRIRITSAEENEPLNGVDAEDKTKKKDTTIIDEDGDNENEISISDIKASLLKPVESDNDNDDCVSETSVPVKPTIEVDIQPAFQPSSTPSHFENGYMVWNSIGIVRSFNSDVDSSIDVDFHDTMLHHAIHRRNLREYVMASLSCKALCLASTSVITCILLNAWDEKKEWSLNIPDGENITALATSGNWVCCATDLNQLRFYGYTGMQRQVVSVSGPVVCMNGHERLLIVVTHLGYGLSGCQNLGCTIFEIMDFFIRALTPCQPLPLTPETKLKWVGFTDEGTPCTYDSAGIIRLSRDFLHWEVVCSTRLHCRNQSDNYFMLGVSERLQCVRCILCKGSWYPMTLPRPTVVEIPLKIPLCDPDESKSTLEDAFWRHVFSVPVLAEASHENDEYSATLKEWEKLLKQTIIKLFAEAYRNRAGMRAVNLASLMSDHPLRMALKLVQSEGRMYIAEKIHNIEPKDWSELRQGPVNVFTRANYVGLVNYDVESNIATETNTKYSQKSQGDMFELSQPSPSTGSRRLAPIVEKESSQEEGSSAPTSAPSSNINPFKVRNKEDRGPKGLSFFNTVQQTSIKPAKPDVGKPDAANTEKTQKGKKVNPPKEKTNTTSQMKFFDWFKIYKPSLEEKYPEMNMNELTKEAMRLYREKVSGANRKEAKEGIENVNKDTEQSPETKRRKVEDDNS